MSHIAIGFFIPFAMAMIVYLLNGRRASLRFLIVTSLAMILFALWAVAPDIPRLFGRVDLYFQLSRDPRCDIFLYHYSIDETDWDDARWWGAVVAVIVGVMLFVAWRELRRAEISRFSGTLPPADPKGTPDGGETRSGRPLAGACPERPPNPCLSVFIRGSNPFRMTSLASCPTRHTMKRIFSILAKLFVALLAVAFALVAAELISRPLFPAWQPVSGDRLFWRHDPLLGWFHAPDSQGTFRHRHFAVEVRHNSLGLRHGELQPLAPGARRMLLLGDSFAWGYGVDARDGIARQMDGRLADWEVVNCGVSGYGTDQAYLLFRERLSGLGAQWVVLLACANDLENNLAAVEYWHNKPRFRVVDGGLKEPDFPVPPPGPGQRLGKQILGRTYLYANIYRRVVKPLLTGRQAAGGAPVGPRLADGSPRVLPETSRPAAAEPPREELFRLLLQALNERVEESGARLALVGVPAHASVEKIFARAARRVGVPFLSLTPAFAEAGDTVIYPDDIHWDAQGHRLAAEAVADFLQRQAIASPEQPLNMENR